MVTCGDSSFSPPQVRHFWPSRNCSNFRSQILLLFEVSLVYTSAFSAEGALKVSVDVLVAVGLCMQEEACYADCHFMVDQSSMHLYFCITSHATYFLILWPLKMKLFFV